MSRLHYGSWVAFRLEDEVTRIGRVVASAEDTKLGSCYSVLMPQHPNPGPYLIPKGSVVGSVPRPIGLTVS